jgi:hypothetical protein
MEEKMRKNILVSQIILIASLFLIFTVSPLFAQTVSKTKTKDVKPTMHKTEMQHMIPKSDMTDMDATMKQMTELVRQTNSMMQSGQVKMAGNNNHETISTASQLHVIAQNMQKITSQLQKITSDKIVMSTPGMDEKTKEIHGDLNNMVNAMNSMIKNMEKNESKPAQAKK